MHASVLKIDMYVNDFEYMINSLSQSSLHMPKLVIIWTNSKKN